MTTSDYGPEFANTEVVIHNPQQRGLLPGPAGGAQGARVPRHRLAAHILSTNKYANYLGPQAGRVDGGTGSVSKSPAR